MIALNNSDQFHWFDPLGAGAGPTRVRKVQHKYNQQVNKFHARVKVDM
jgi:hypothetical protein